MVIRDAYVETIAYRQSDEPSLSASLADDVIRQNYVIILSNDVIGCEYAIHSAGLTESIA